MVDLITFNRGSDTLASSRLLDKDLLIKTEQTNGKNILSCNKDSKLRIDDASDGESSSIFKTSSSKQKKVISMSSISRLSTPRRSYKSDDPPVLTTVKISALLYEITERINQLAQPRSRITEAQISEKTLKNKVSKSISSRIIELACPKVIHDSAPKPISFVSPNALKAIATQRIIELSQPRKDRRYKTLSRRKTQIRRSCNLRIHDLSKSKQMDHSRVKAKLSDSLEENKLDTKKLLQGSLHLTSNIGRDSRHTRRRFKRKDKSREEMRKRQSSLHRLSNTNSDRSVVIVGLDWKKRPRFSNARVSRIRSRRYKSSRMTKGSIINQ